MDVRLRLQSHAFTPTVDKNDIVSLKQNEAKKKKNKTNRHGFVGRVFLKRHFKIVSAMKWLYKSDQIHLPNITNNMCI